MKPKDVPIRRQIIRVIMLTSSMVLLLASMAFISYELLALRQSTVESLTALAQVIADNSAAPLAFQNEKDAREVLAALKVNTHIQAAALYTADGRLYVTFPEGLARENFPSVARKIGHRFDRWSLELFEPVAQAGAGLGALYLRSDLGAIFQRLKIYGLTTLLVMGGALFMAFFFSRILQQRISGPILALTETARIVSERGDYSLRAKKLSGGEPGVLTDGFNRMLDELQARQQALAQSEERLRALANSIPQLAWIARPDGSIIWYNQRWYQYTGTTPGQMEGWGWQSVHDPTVLPQVLERWRSSLRTGEPFEMEFPLRGADGSFRRFLTRAVPLKDAAGQVAQWFGTNTDITEILEAREALTRSREELERLVHARTADLAAANHELEAFGYSVSHDLRAPLRHVSSYVKMLEKNAGATLDEKSRRHIKIIAEAAQRMGRLIDDLLVLSRLGRTTMTETKVSLSNLVEEARQELKPETVGRTIQWQIGPLPKVRGDRTLLRSAIVNLLSNAIKYTRGRNPARIEIGNREENGEVVCFVKDNGAGFDMQFVGKLFGVFQRLHRVEEFEGTGIGLASVRRVFQRHDGRTWAEGELERGATFYFSFPMARVVPEKDPGNPSSEPSPNEELLQGKDLTA